MIQTTGWRQCEPLEVTVANQLQQLAGERDYKSLSKVLDKIIVREKGVLGVEECKVEGLGDESKITITFPDGRVINQNDEDFWKYISTENSVLGLWQIYLLKNLWHYLPLFWHANYDKRDYIYTREQMTIINSKPAFGDEPIENLDFSRYNIAPRIEAKEGRYIISACYWCDFEGLVREELPMGINIKGQIVFYEETRHILFQYNCGILF